MSKRLLLNGFLALVVVGIAVGSYLTVHSTKSSASTTQTFATATRGNVLESVTSTGNVEAPTDLSLSFQQSGQVTAIPVSVGEHVGAGQVLAKVDDTEQKLALEGAQAGLTSAQASLAALYRGETPIERQADAESVISAQQGITSAQQGVTNAEQDAAANVSKYQDAINQAKEGLTTANSGVTSAQTTLTQAELALTSIQNTSDPAHSSGESLAATMTRYSLDQAYCSSHMGATKVPSDNVPCAQIANLVSFAKGVQAAQSGLAQAQTQVTTAQTQVATAQQGQTSGEMQDQQSIQQAQTQLTQAQQQYNSTVVGNEVKEEPPKPEQIAQANASVISAQGQLATAQKNESDTVLRAPVSGVVAAVNGIVGQQSSGGSASSSSSSSSASTGSSSSSSGSSSGFIVLTNVNVLDVSVGFTETDAPNVHVGQAADITLDALPNQTFTGHVIELDTDSTLVSNVVTYNSLVAFDTAPAGVKPGMTASVNVVLAKRDDVITLPTSAVSTTGTTESVTVKPAHGSETTRTISIGLRGDNAVEITSGLSVGDQVVITTAASTGTGLGGAATRLGGGGLGGLGGGGFGGGGGGGRGG